MGLSRNILNLSKYLDDAKSMPEKEVNRIDMNGGRGRSPDAGIRFFFENNTIDEL
jgi:hypothetical protein